MGAIMAAGIIDAGGRNVTVGLRSRSGYFRRTSLIGARRGWSAQQWSSNTEVGFKVLQKPPRY